MEGSNTSKQDPFNFIRIPVKSTVSYLLSNISTSESYIATCRQTTSEPPKLMIFQLKNKSVKGNEYEVLQDSEALITFFTYIKLRDQWRLLVCLRDCVKIYSEDGQTLFFHFLLQVPSNKKKEAEKMGISHYFSCATKAFFNKQELIAVATSLGEVILMEEKEKKPNSFQNYTALTGTGLGGIPTQMIDISDENQIIMATNEGKILIFLIKDLKKMELQKEVDIANKRTPITGLGTLKSASTKNNYVLTGDFLGKIKVFDQKNWNLLMEINSHARLITSLDTRNESMDILTSSEDSFLNYWKIEEEEQGIKVALKVSFRIADQIIVGAKFLKNANESAISIFDSNEITLLKYEKN